MAKELPFFKFEPSEWAFGRIQRQSDTIKARFIDLLCKYWHNRCVMALEDCLLDFGEEEVNTMLKTRIIREEEGFVRIDFLDAQMEEIDKKTAQNRRAGQASAEARRQKAMSDRSTTVQQTRQEETIQEEKRKDNTTIYEKSVSDCFDKCIMFFPESLRPKKESDINNWKKTIRDLYELDKIPYEAIEKITELARSDDFWSKNFLSIVKLRRKDPQKVKYIQVFYEKFVKNGKSKPNYDNAEQFADSVAGIASRIS